MGRTRIPAFTYRYSYADGEVDTTNWKEIEDSLGMSCTELEIFDSSGQVLEFGIGPAGSEVRQFFIMPGGNAQRVGQILNAGMRLAIRAVSAATGSSGQIVINGYR